MKPFLRFYSRFERVTLLFLFLWLNGFLSFKPINPLHYFIKRLPIKGFLQNIPIRYIRFWRDFFIKPGSECRVCIVTEVFLIVRYRLKFFFKCMLDCGINTIINRLNLLVECLKLGVIIRIS
jgi:hypothetical protein